MGGYGSGRQDGRVKTDQVPSLDVRHLNRRGVLAPGTFTQWSWGGPSGFSIHLHAQGDHVLLQHWVRMSDGEDRRVEYPVMLDRTPCNFGGTRTWFRCPSPRCGRRVAILYKGRFFACRHCLQLAYASQRSGARNALTGERTRSGIGLAGTVTTGGNREGCGGGRSSG
jgi:hypothetical protein